MISHIFCQVRVSRFYQTCFLLLLLRSDLNCECRISVGTAGPQLRAPDLSGHCGTSTASARPQWALSERRGPDGVNGAGEGQISVGTVGTARARPLWALPDLNCERQSSVGTAGLQPRAPDLSGHCPNGEGQTGLMVKARSRWALSERRGPDLCGHYRTSTASARAQWALRDFNRERQSSVGTAGPQPRAPDLSGHWPDLNCECKMSHTMSDRMPDRTETVLDTYVMWCFDVVFLSG